MNILITGASGFIGKNILEQLGNRYHCLVPSHKDLDLENKIAVNEYFLNNQIDIVVHTANIGGTKKTAHLTNTIDKNLNMFLNLAGNKHLFKKMLFLGSGAEYDKTQNISSVTEEEFGKRIPKDDYGFAKYSCSKLINQTENIYNLRCFAVFGKYEDASQRFISNVICNVLLDKPVTMNQNVLFDFIWVKDLVTIIEQFFTLETKYRFFNVGSGAKVSLIDLIAIIKEVSGKNFEVIIKNSGINKEYTCNIDRLKSELKDFEFTPLKKSITELYNYYQAHLSEIEL